jgi:hypothetical protein
MSESILPTFEFPPALIEALARRAAEIVVEENAGYLDVKGAALFLGGCSTKRVYNLVERQAIPYHNRTEGCCSTHASSASGWTTHDPRADRS